MGDAIRPPGSRRVRPRHPYRRAFRKDRLMLRVRACDLSDVGPTRADTEDYQVDPRTNSTWSPTASTTTADGEVVVECRRAPSTIHAPEYADRPDHLAFVGIVAPRRALRPLPMGAIALRTIKVLAPSASTGLLDGWEPSSSASLEVPLHHRGRRR